MKKRGMLILVFSLILLAGIVQAQQVRPLPGARPAAVQIVQLEMFPDPVREG